MTQFLFVILLTYRQQMLNTHLTILFDILAPGLDSNHRFTYFRIRISKCTKDKINCLSIVTCVCISETIDNASYYISSLVSIIYAVFLINGTIYLV